MWCLLMSAALGAAPGPVHAIDAVLADFTQGAATRDVGRVSRSLHAEARQYVTMGGALQVLETQEYLDLLDAGKIGGVATERTVEGVELDAGCAMVQQVRRAGPYIFHDAVTLVEGAEGWRIVSVAVRVESSP